MGLTVAVPKGRLGLKALEMLRAAGLSESVDLSSRKLVFEERQGLRFILLKNADVLTYVESGAADIGISGRDMIVETAADVYELYRMRIGRCRMAVAGVKGGGGLREVEVIRVATKFPRWARRYFGDMGQRISIVGLNGSVELAPVMGLSDVIVDIVETGGTLAANGLEVYADMGQISAAIVSNKISYKFKRDEINAVVDAIRREDEKND